MSPRPRTPLVAWLLIAALLLLAVAPPAGLEVCVGEDGHVHIGVGEFDGGVDGIGCICLDACSDGVGADDACACYEESHGHKDFGIDSIALMQRERDGSLVLLLPDAEPAPLVLLSAGVGAGEVERPRDTVVAHERPPQWPPAQRSPILRS